MNYIRHLNTFFYYVKHDTSLTAMHVSLYMGLFQVWNSNRFRQPFSVFRDQVMQLSRIGSKNTYHKCLKELHTAGYIQVQPGLSKYMPAKIFMRDFEKHVPPVIQSNLFEVQDTGDSQKLTPTPIATSSRARLSPFELSEAVSRSSPSDRQAQRSNGPLKISCASGGGPLATSTTRARLSPFELSEAVSRSSPSDRQAQRSNGPLKISCASGGGPLATGTTRAGLSPFGGGVCKPLCASGGGQLATGTTRAGISPFELSEAVSRSSPSDRQAQRSNGPLKISCASGGGPLAITNPPISEPVSVPDSAPNPPKTDTHTVPDLRPLDKPLNIIKESKTTPSVPIKKKPKERKGPFPPDQNLVEAFFREQGQPSTEARKFYLYYQSIGWRVQGGTTPITDWKATAEKWILNDKTYNSNANSRRNSKTPPNPHYTRADKDYSEPL